MKRKNIVKITYIFGYTIHTYIYLFIVITVLTSKQNGILNALFEHRSSYSRNKSFKHLILMMLARATIPLELKAGSIFTINLNLLVKVSSVIVYLL